MAKKSISQESHSFRTDKVSLPVDHILGDIRTKLRVGTRLVIEAPPGAGKTTRVPPALLAEDWLDGRRILILEPRRLAARTAAARMAAELGEPPGRSVGVTTRFDRLSGKNTRIEVVTEGILTRRLQADPALDGVAAIIFDEFHERSLQADLGLALALEAQEALRDDLRLVVMSATLDGVAVADLMGGAPVLAAEGQTFPVETRYRPPPRGRNRQPDPIAAVPDIVSESLAADEGDILVFLPGQGEIRRAATALRNRWAGRDVDIFELFADLATEKQNAAIMPGPPGRRKVVLATTIAETSLTIDGIKVVVDSGMKRVPRLDPAVGLTRLVTVGVSRASADQRRGRAGRTAPGLCYRLWAENAHGSLPPFDRPEMLDADLSGLVLDLACWGVTDPAGMAWLDRPPEGAWRTARDLLERLGALDADGRVTPHGRAMTGIPLHPRLAHMVMLASPGPERRLATLIAGLLEERDLSVAAGADIVQRVRLLTTGAGLKSLPPQDRGVADRIRRLIQRLEGVFKGDPNWGEPFAEPPMESVGPLVARAYPDRIAGRRRQGGADFLLTNGRGAVLESDDDFSGATYLAVGDISGDRRAGRVRRAAALNLSTLEALFADRITSETEIRWDEDKGTLVARDVRRLEALVLDEKGRSVPASSDAAVDAMIAMIRSNDLRCLPWTEAARRLQARIAFARQWARHYPRHHPRQYHDDDRTDGRPSGQVPVCDWPDLSDDTLKADLEVWLAPMLAGVTTRADLARLDLLTILTGHVGWQQMRELDRLFPDRWPVPSGRAHPIDYRAEGGPLLSVRLQEMFGCDETPSVADGTVAVTVALLSPAGRPIQVTGDLAGFWRGSYSQVRRDMRGRYPKHDWPEDPTAPSSTRPGPGASPESGSGRAATQGRKRRQSQGG